MLSKWTSAAFTSENGALAADHTFKMVSPTLWLTTGMFEKTFTLAASCIWPPHTAPYTEFSTAREGVGISGNLMTELRKRTAIV